MKNLRPPLMQRNKEWHTLRAPFYMYLGDDLVFRLKVSEVFKTDNLIMTWPTQDYRIGEIDD